MGKFRNTDEESNLDGKQSTCYGCGTILRSLTILVCAECLDDFVIKAEEEPIIEKKE